MAGSHVPTFGNWDDDSVPYTTYFENARKERAGVIMNANDPEAFMYMKGKLERDGDPSLFQVPRLVNSDKPISAGTRNAEGHRKHNAHLRQGHRGMSLESGSEKSNSEHSLAGHRYANSDKRKGLAEDKNRFSVSVSGHSRLRNGTYTSDESKHHRTPSVPKFGAWDAADPKSGDGFTVIFNKVREDKQSSSQFPVEPPQPSNFLDGHSTRRSSSPESKTCCCVFSRKRT